MERPQWLTDVHLGQILGDRLSMHESRCAKNGGVHVGSKVGGGGGRSRILSLREYAGMYQPIREACPPPPGTADDFASG
eukprot:6183801-Pleurochrysis_carterae.AAC.1